MREYIIGRCELPVLSPAAVQVLQLTERRSTGLDDVAEIIGRDPELSEGVVRAINSSFQDLRRNVGSVRQAVGILGLQSVQTLVLRLSLARALPENSEGQLAVFWQRCVFAAAGARVLASRILPKNADECFIAALMMDLGALLLELTLVEQYMPVKRRVTDHSQLAAVETEVLQVNHTEIGAMLVRQWSMPAAIEVPVGAHHNPQSVESHRLRAIAEILELSERCADVFLSEEPSGAISLARQALANQHGVSLAEADKLLARIGQKASELAPLVLVSAGSCNYASLLEKATPSLLAQALGRRQSNQRRAKRLTREGTLPLFPCAHGALGREVRVNLRDLSATGIGVIHNKAMSRGSQFVICLPQPGGSTKSLLYTAIRCEPLGSQYQIGAELRAVLRTSEAAPADDETDYNSCGAD